MVSEQWKVGDVCSWNGWDAIVVEVYPEQYYGYRLEIQTVTGEGFTILATHGEVRPRGRNSRLYSQGLTAAMVEVEAEDRRSKDREEETAWLWEQVYRYEDSLSQWKLGAGLLGAFALAAGFVWGYLSR